jgi:hypothetical protein
LAAQADTTDLWQSPKRLVLVYAWLASPFGFHTEIFLVDISR